MAVGLFLEWSINSTHLRAALLATTEVRCSNGECSTSPGQSLRRPAGLSVFRKLNVGRKCPAETSGKYINGGLSYDQIQKTVFYISGNFSAGNFRTYSLIGQYFFLLSLSPWGPDSLNFPNPALPATLICLTMYDYIFLNTQ